MVITTAHRRRTVSPESVDLLRRAQSGDRDAFGRLYADHIALITRYVAVRLRDRDRDAVPDVVHNAFTDALAEIRDAHADVTGWLLQLAARACIRHGWTTRRFRRAAHEVHEHPSPPPIFTPPGLSARLVLVLGLARLSDNQRQALQLRYLDGYPRDLTARLMGRSSEAVRDLERRGLRHLHAAVTATEPTTRSLTSLTTKDEHDG